MKLNLLKGIYLYAFFDDNQFFSYKNKFNEIKNSLLYCNDEKKQMIIQESQKIIGILKEMDNN